MWGEYSGRRTIWKKLNSSFQRRLSYKDKTQNHFILSKKKKNCLNTMQTDKRLGMSSAQIIIKTQIGHIYLGQKITTLFPTWFFFMYLWHVSVVKFCLDIFSLVSKRVGNPQLCIPTHSEALAHLSFQFLPAFLKKVVFLSSSPLQSWAFMPISRIWAEEPDTVATLQLILVSPTQHILSTKADH